MRGRGLTRLLVPLQIFLLLGSLFLPALAAAATIQTDLWVYQDGDTVTVTGDGFGPSELVDFVTTDPNGAVIDQGSVSADDLGNVTYAFTLHATVAGIYGEVATGESSGLSASTEFDPGPSVASVVSQSTTEGSASHPISVTVKMGGGTSPSTIPVYWRTQNGSATGGAACGPGVDFVAISQLPGVN
jgi:hypothetical protein